MIVQSAPEGQAHLVIFQADHARLSGQFAAVFGNEKFVSLTPKIPVEFTAGHHDEGWLPIDARVEQDRNTGLPYHLTQTPLPYLVKTSAGSPTFNERFHPYSGILSSMHTYGLFNGRYGLSDKIFVDLVPEENKPAVEDMLRAELDRQERLIELLHTDEEASNWISEVHLFHNYKLLQFFDTLALYFQVEHENFRQESFFPNVPRGLGDDISLKLQPVEPGLYALSPYPFREEGLTFHFQGRLLKPEPVGSDLKAIWENARPQQETFRLIAG